MKKLNHTVNLACAINLVILDDEGKPARAIICPLLLLFCHLPAWLYYLISKNPLPPPKARTRQGAERARGRGLGWRFRRLAPLWSLFADIEHALHGDLYQLILGLRLPIAAG